jgi:hypothetical protein
MRIIFGFEQDLPPKDIQYMYEGSTGIILTEIKDFVRHRLAVLEEDKQA